MIHSNCIDTMNRNTVLPMTWLGWMKTGTGMLVRDFRDLLDNLLEWQRRTNSRRELLALDRRLLDDIGISRIDAVREGNKPFWRE